MLKHTHTYTESQRKKHCRMLEPFSNTLEDLAKHKVRELGCVPLFPTLVRPLELCHQLINEHNALSFSLSLSLNILLGDFLFHAVAQKFESLDCLGKRMLCLLNSFCATTCVHSHMNSLHHDHIPKNWSLLLMQQGNTSCFQLLRTRLLLLMRW